MGIARVTPERSGCPSGPNIPFIPQLSGKPDSLSPVLRETE